MTADPSASRPPVPLVLRVYGWIIIVLGVVAVLFGILRIAFGWRNSLLLGLDVAVLVVNLLCVRLGVGLKAGHRASVYGLCLLGALAVLVGVTGIANRNVLVGCVILGVATVFYLVPSVIAFLNWKAFA